MEYNISNQRNQIRIEKLGDRQKVKPFSMKLKILHSPKRQRGGFTQIYHHNMPLNWRDAGIYAKQTHNAQLNSPSLNERFVKNRTFHQRHNSQLK